MRKINGKLFLGLLLGAAALAVTVAVVHHFQYQRIARALLFQANRAEQQGQADKQARYLGRYLEFNPRDTAEKGNLARLWASDPNASPKRKAEAVRLLDEVLTYEDSPPLRRLLVRTAIELGDFKRAREHLVKLLPQGELDAWMTEDRRARATGRPMPELMAREDRDRGELELFWGQFLEQEKKTADAQACYRLAARHAPQQQQAYLRLAYLTRRSGEGDAAQRTRDRAEADRAVDQMVERNADRHDAYLARWRYRRDFDLLAIRETLSPGQLKLEVAAEDVAAALKRKPESIDVLLAAADLERLRGRAVAEAPGRTPQQRRDGLRAHRARALDQLKKGLELVKRSGGAAGQAEFQLLWHKGNLLLDDLDLLRAEGDETQSAPAMAEVRGVIAVVRKSRVPAAGDYMEGRLLVHESKWAEAATRFERARALLAAQPDLAAQADLYLGQCYEKLEEHTQMYNAYKRVADWDPNSVAAQLGMAAARWAQGKLDGASEQYRAAVRGGRVPTRAWMDLARLELQRQAQSSKPDWAAVETALTEAAKHNADRAGVELAMLRAELRMRQGKPDEARSVLEQQRDKTPGEIELWAALVDLALRQKDMDQARKVVDAARARLGDTAGTRLAEARYLAAKKGKGARAEIAALARDREKLSEEEQGRLLSGLADTLYRLEGAREARALWQEVVKLPRFRADLRLRLLLFDLAMREGDEPGMKQVLADIRGVEQTSGAYHRYGQALLAIWQARQAAPGDKRDAALKIARQELEAVLTVRPSWAPVFVARSEIAELTGNTEQALRDLQEALKNGETGTTAVRRLVTLLTRKGRDDEAQQLLARLQPAALAQSELGRVLVGLEVRRGNVGKAVEMMRQMINEENQGPQDLVWQARVLAAAGKPKEAEAKLDQAARVAGDDPTPWLGKVQFLVEQKRRDEAIRLIGGLKTKLPPKQAELALARCYDFVGQYAEARKHYAAALQAAPTDAVTIKAVASAHLLANRGREAEPLLERIVSGKVQGVSESDAAWARRGLAVALASGTDYQRFKRALGLVGLKLDANGVLEKDDSRDENSEQQRAKARVLASQNQRQFRQRAIELFKELSRRGALTADDEYVLALLHEQEGETRLAQERLKQLAEPRHRTPQYLAQYAMSLIVHRRLPGDLDEAGKVIGWIEGLERDRDLPPNTFASVELRARVLEARDKGDEAVALLKKHTSRPGAVPEEVLLVIASYGRQKRYREAFDLCENSWEGGACSPEAIGSVCVALLGVMKPTDAQVAAVEKHLKAALAKKASNVLRLHLADLYDKRGRYDDAAELYREVLKTEKNNVVALNNLAWLLSQRTGDARQALVHIDTAIRGIGRRADLLDTRGIVHLALKDTTKALADLKEATREGATAARLLHLARAHHADRDEAKARATLLRAKEKGLEVAALHPVEQEAARKLLEAYGMR